MALIEDAGEHVTLIYASRSRQAVDARRFVGRGIAALCDARELAFDFEETARMVEASEMNHTDRGIKRLLEDTEGWAAAVTGTIRTAAAENLVLEEAFVNWRVRSEAFLQELMEVELLRVEPQDAALFRRAAGGEAIAGAKDALRRLAGQGLFLTECGDGDITLYRALRSVTAKHAPDVMRSSPSSMRVQLFQSFRATIEGREIPWVRRRDQQIFKYLALKPNGSATRAEVAAIFWPDADRHSAVQSLRTACSTIRKAIASIVGYGAVENYFRTAPDIQIDLNNVVTDVRRFCAHAADGDDIFANGDIDRAMAHYRTAERQYTGRLLEFEQPQSWFAADAATLETRYLVALERLADAALEKKDASTAREYAFRARALRPNQPTIESLLGRAVELAELSARSAMKSRRIVREMEPERRAATSPIAV